MENREDSPQSLPYIDDTLPDEEINPHQYNLKIIENYHNKNRNIEITNRYPKDSVKSLSPVAPLADETEFSDTPDEDNQVRKPSSGESGVKVVIKGWNSSISIQGLDNKSSITFQRRCEKMHKKVEKRGEGKQGSEERKPPEKSRKGRWRMLTKSIMLAKSARFERRGLDERYPKYVLLKNEEEEVTSVTSVKENYPKMFVFNDKDGRQKRNAEPKPEFSFKKSFKNKTEPIIPLDEILAKTDDVQSEQPKTKLKTNIKKKKPLTERNVTIKKKTVVERRTSLTTEKPVLSESQVGEPHGQVFNEIQGIFEDALKLYPQPQTNPAQQQPLSREYCSSEPPFCQFPCHNLCCCHNQPPKYVPACAPNRSSIPQSKCQDQEIPGEHNERDIELENLPFGILSSFFPRVVIMKAVRSEGLRGEEEIISAAKETDLSIHQLPEAEGPTDQEREIGSLEVPQPDLTLKSKLVRDSLKPEGEDFFMGNVSLKEFPDFEEDQKTKSQESVATEYLHYSEFDPAENESIEPTNPPPTSPPRNQSKQEKEDKNLSSGDKFKTEDIDGNPENLSLTKIGYKMYDNLTKLSLNREKEITKKAEVSGCGCNGNGTKKSPYNITLESTNGVVKVTVPENELNFQIVNSEGGDIQIGVTKGKEDEDGDKTLVRREELWHVDGGGRALVLKNEASRDVERKGFQKFKVSLADSTEIVLSIEANENDKNQRKMEVKSTKEMKVGTDDFELAGGDFVCALVLTMTAADKAVETSTKRNYRNLSPRIGQLLKHLHEKLETDQKERKFLDEKINQKLIDQKFQGGGVLPGLFLVKHLSPRTSVAPKPPEVSSLRKTKKAENRGQLREYYCEECLATMRIFEDENPSVKSMVDKFETIIQLESY